MGRDVCEILPDDRSGVGETSCVTLYGYCDFTLDGRPYYVGIGCERRTKIRRRNQKHTVIANKHGFVRKILVTLVGERIQVWSSLCEWEKSQIIALGTLHQEGQIGCNFTIGGDGIVGFKRVKSESERKKISDSKKKLYSSADERRRLGESIRLAKSDPVKHRNHCEGQRKRYADPAQRQKAFEVNVQKKRVQQFTSDGSFIQEFPSMSTAVRETGILNIKQVAAGRRKLAGGFVWKYVED